MNVDFKECDVDAFCKLYDNLRLKSNVPLEVSYYTQSSHKSCLKILNTPLQSKMNWIPNSISKSLVHAMKTGSTKKCSVGMLRQMSHLYWGESIVSSWKYQFYCSFKPFVDWVFLINLRIVKCGASEVAFQTSFISASLNMLDDLVKLQQGTIKVADKFADKHYLLKKTKVCKVCPLASICFLQAFFSFLRLNWFPFDMLF